MITYRPGMTFVGMFCTQRFDTGVATDADSLPVATASKNGVDDAGFSLTVAKIDTGRYKATGTIPLSYSAEDVVHVSVEATVNGVAGKAVIDEFVIEEASGANTVTITVEESDHTPIPDVSVQILNDTETLTLNTGITDASGRLIVALNDGTYKVRLCKAMVNFSNPETLTVSGATSQAFTGSPITPSAPAAGLQTIFIIPTDLGLVYSPTMVFTAVISEMNEHISDAILSNQILTAIDKGSFFEMQIAKLAKVTITGYNGTTKFLKKNVTITPDDTMSLASYL